MPLVLPPLPYPKDALAPAISAATLQLHHEKHHKAYVDKLPLTRRFAPPSPAGRGKNYEMW